MENLEKEFTAYVTLLSVMNQIEQMVTPAEIQLGITSLVRINDLLKKAKEISDKTQNLEFKEILTEIRSELVDVKGELIDSKDIINKLKEENQKLKGKIKESQPKVYLVGGFYYTTEDGKGGTGPYCTGCYDKNKEIIRLTTEKILNGLICPCCKMTYEQGQHHPLRYADSSYKEAIDELQRKKEERIKKRQSLSEG